MPRVNELIFILTYTYSCLWPRLWPSDNSLEQISTTSVRVEWSQPTGGATVTGYLHYSDRVSDWTESVAASSTTHIAGLVTNTRHTFTTEAMLEHLLWWLDINYILYLLLHQHTSNGIIAHLTFGAHARVTVVGLSVSVCPLPLICDPRLQGGKRAIPTASVLRVATLVLKRSVFPKTASFKSYCVKHERKKPIYKWV